MLMCLLVAKNGKLVKSTVCACTGKTTNKCVTQFLINLQVNGLALYQIA